MRDSTKKTYMGGEDTGFPEIERSLTNKDITNRIAESLPQFSEFYGQKPGAAPDGLVKYLKQSEFKKPYGSPNEETPDYPDMEYKFAPPVVGPPVLPGLPNFPPGEPGVFAIFELEIVGNVCPGQWSTIRLIGTEPIYRAELMSPYPLEEIKPGGTGKGLWRKAKVYVPNSSAGGVVRIKAFMKSPEGILGASNDVTDVEELDADACPRTFMDIRLTFTKSSGGTYARTFVWDFRRQKVATDILDGPGGSPVTFPLSNDSSLTYWRSLMERTVPVNNWYRTQTATMTRTDCGCCDWSPEWNNCGSFPGPTCSPSAESGDLWDYNGSVWEGCSFSCYFRSDGTCQPTVCTAEGLYLYDSSEKTIAPYQLAKNGIFNIGGIANESTLKDVFTVETSSSGTAREYPSHGPPPNCLCLIGAPKSWDTFDNTIYMAHDGHVIINETLSDPGRTLGSGQDCWIWGNNSFSLDDQVMALALAIPYVSSWNYGKPSPESPDHTTDIYIALFDYCDAVYDRDNWHHFGGCYAGAKYDNAGANYGTTTGIDLTGPSESALKNIIQDIIDAAITDIGNGGYFSALNASLQFYYGKY